MDVAIAPPPVPAPPAGHPLRDLAEILRCPRCHGRLDLRDARPRCTSLDCDYARDGFPLAAGQPVLVDFENSVFDPAAYTAASAGSVLTRDDETFRRRFSRFITGTNPVAGTMAAQLATLLKAKSHAPILLVIGGGARGSGADTLYADPAIKIVGTDVYASSNTRLVADGHSLPFADASFDGVWIQAVLEHVLDPADVVAEIVRVLKPDGLVYAETPFMQQVHEQAYDFTRFTKSGHRWLFRRFAEIDAGRRQRRGHRACLVDPLLGAHPHRLQQNRHARNVADILAAVLRSVRRAACSQ